MDDHTPNTGVVTFLGDDGVKRTIDFALVKHLPAVNHGCRLASAQQS
jgi:hypothetical protein